MELEDVFWLLAFGIRHANRNQIYHYWALVKYWTGEGVGVVVGIYVGVTVHLNIGKKRPIFGDIRNLIENDFEVERIGSVFLRPTISPEIKWDHVIYIHRGTHIPISAMSSSISVNRSPWYLWSSTLAISAMIALKPAAYTLPLNKRFLRDPVEYSRRQLSI